jgi:divalent metal cation (Fe/Co/Zn/Cd) transporter
MIHKHELLSIANDRLRRQAVFASIGVASVLIAAKLTAYVMTDSVAMLSSLLDSTFDLVASVVTAYGVHSALRPPDRNHRYGHGKAEPLAVLAQAAFIIGSSALLVYEAAQRLYRPHDIRLCCNGPSHFVDDLFGSLPASRCPQDRVSCYRRRPIALSWRPWR